MSGKRPTAAVLYNPPSLPPDHRDYASEADVVAVARAIASILVEAGFEAWLQPAAPPLIDLLGELTNTSPDLVFNLIEGFAGDTSGESHITGLLELLRIPYTGCPPEAQSLCHEKGRTKALLRGFGLPTAPFAVATTDEEIDLPFDGPYLVKPDAQDASLGIDQGSVIVGRATVAERVALLRREYGPRVLIEAYLPGPEYNVGVLALPEPVALTTAEVTYAERPGKWPILTYDAKWDIGSAEDLASPIRCPADLDPELAEILGALAIAAFVATGCRDYARVDFRLDSCGEPMILEVNPNPDIGPTAGWARALIASGRDYGATIVALARQAIARGPRHV
jgi:D-alanine-D-alanine ligase